MATAFAFCTRQANVDYQVVASFVIQDEKQNSIPEALSEIKQWNPCWYPIDNNNEEKNSIQSIFPC